MCENFVGGGSECCGILVMVAVVMMVTFELVADGR